MTIKIRGLLLILILVVAPQARAEIWPSRPVKLIVPANAGHAFDIMARMIASGVSQGLGQTVYVENMPGASGIVGAQAAARANPDGDTFFFAAASVLSSNMYLFKALPYNPARDFSAVAMVCDRGPMVISVNPDLPVKTIPELVAYGKANPGKLSYAVDASGGFALAAGRLLNKEGGIGMVEVPYRSSPQMVQDTIAGTVQVMVSSIPAVAGAQAAGKLRFLAVSSDNRFPGYDNIPTIAETFPGFRIDGWFAVVAPAGTPPDILLKMNREINKVLQSPDIRQRALGFGLGVSDASTPDTTETYIHSEQDRWGHLVSELGMQAQ
jgi:tripartite-type tricarboxylate transporter receptor subunit TctC